MKITCYNFIFISAEFLLRVEFSFERGAVFSWKPVSTVSGARVKRGYVWHVRRLEPTRSRSTSWHCSTRSVLWSSTPYNASQGARRLRESNGGGLYRIASRNTLYFRVPLPTSSGNSTHTQLLLEQLQMASSQIAQLAANDEGITIQVRG